MKFTWGFDMKKDGKYCNLVMGDVKENLKC